MIRAHTLSPESPLCLVPHVPRRLGQTVSVVLADICVHAPWSVTVLSIPMRTTGLWRCRVDVGVHSRLSPSWRLLARSPTISHHRSLNTSSTSCMNHQHRLSSQCQPSALQCSSSPSYPWVSSFSGSYRRVGSSCRRRVDLDTIL